MKRIMPVSQFGRLAVVAASLILNAAIFVGCGAEVTDQQHVQRAKDFHDKGDHKSSVIELKNALQLNAENIEARWLLGEIYVQLGQGAAAEKEIRRALELGMDRKVVHLTIGEALLLQGDYERLYEEIRPIDGMGAGELASLYALRAEAYIADRKLDEAKESLAKASGLKQDSIAVLIAKARLAAVYSRFDEARDWIDKALRGSPNSTSAWTLLGDLERAHGQAKEAEKAYSNALARNKYYILARMNRALMRVYIGDYDGAAKDISLLNKLAPNHPRVHFVQGVYLLNQKRPAEAQGAFEASLRTQPNYSATHYYLGIAHYIQGHWQQAENYFAQVVQRYPGNSDARKLLGAVRVGLGDFAGAEEVLRPTIQIDTEDAHALALLGNVLLLQGKAEQGIEYLEKALAIKPGLADARMQIGVGLLSLGKMNTGLQHLQTAVDLDPKGQQAEVILFVNLLRLKNYDKLIETAERLREKKPNDPLALNFIGLAYLGKGDEAKARAVLNNSWEKNPGDPLTAENLARIALKEGEQDKARQYLLEVKKQHPEYVDVYLKLSELEAGDGNVEKSIAWLEEAVRLKPTALMPRVMLARLNLMMNKPSKALAVLAQASESFSTNPALLEVMGQAQLDLQESSRAISTFEKLKKIQPDSADAHFNLAKAHLLQGGYEMAHLLLQRATELAPEHILAKSTLVRLLLVQDKVERARETYNELKQRFPRHPQVMALEGLIWMKEKKYRRAAAVFQDALKQTESRDLTLYLAEAYWKGGERQKSIDILGKWLEVNPEDVAARFWRANFLRSLKDFAGAEAEYRKVLDVEPKSISALNNLAMLLRKDDPQQALKYAERAYGLGPKVPMVLDTLGVVLLNLGEKERALRLLKEAADKAPGNRTINYHYAKALADQGNTDQALLILRKILSGDTSFEEAKEAHSLRMKLGG